MKNMLILGLGLIGGSMALAAKQKGLVETVSAWGRNEDKLKQGYDLGVIDDYSTELAPLLKKADLIVVATPVLVAEKLLVSLFNEYKTQAIVTDVGSTKGNLIRAIKQAMPGVPANLVLAHPIAGAETSGVESARQDLFERHRVIVTPTTETDAQAVQTVENFWRNIGAEVIEMTVQQHDEVLAATSHLPHMLAYALVDALACMEENDQEVFRFAAGGFRDFTRIAKSNPEMWHDIALANKSSVIKSIDKFTLHLTRLRDAISDDDSQTIMQTLEHVSSTRKNLHETVLPKK